jgi:nucleotide-binding universal stress UspA family protein
MREYRRILAVVELDSVGEAVAQRTLALGRLTRSHVAFLHVVDVDAAADGGYPAPSRARLAADYESAAAFRLTHLAARVGAGEAEIHARFGEPRATVDAFAREWAPDLVVTATSDITRALGVGCDVLTLHATQRSHGGRLARMLKKILAPLAALQGV